MLPQPARVLATVAIMIWSGVAQAQNPPPQIDIQLTRPIPDSQRILNVPTAVVDSSWIPTFLASLDWSRRPFRATLDNSLPLGDFVSNRLDVSVGASITVLQRAVVGVLLPVVVQQAGLNTRVVQLAAGSDSLESSGLGDLRIYAKGQIIRHDTLPNVALSLDVSIPTGMPEDFAGEPGYTILPSVVSSWSRNHHEVAVSVGPLVRTQTQRASTLTVDHQFAYSAAYAVGLSGRYAASPVHGVASVAGRTPLTPGGNAAIHYPVVVDAGLRYRVAAGAGRFQVTSVVGLGLSPGYGSPLPRVSVGASYLTLDPQTDTDGDEIPNIVDRCPSEKEDLDDFEDDDGCPEEDNDQDGIPDEDDECPLEKEVYNQVDDQDGCPDIRATDRDKDRISDLIDACPDEPEDLDNYQDADGCPEIDNDLDGLNDLNDLCPDAPEDEPGPDADGCPSTVKFGATGEITLRKRILFEGRRPTQESVEVLEELVEVLNAKPEVTRLRIHLIPKRRNQRVRKATKQRGEALSKLLARMGLRTPVKVDVAPHDPNLPGWVRFEVEGLAPSSTPPPEVPAGAPPTSGTPTAGEPSPSKATAEQPGPESEEPAVETDLPADPKAKSKDRRRRRKGKRRRQR